MENKDSYREIAAEMVQLAKSDFEYVRVFVSASEEREVEVRDGKPENSSFSESVSMSIVASRDGRTASASGSDISPDGREFLISSVRELIQVVEPDPWYVIPEKEMIGAADAKLDLVDDAYETRTVDQLLAEAKDLEQQALALDKRVISAGAAVSASRVAGAFACSFDFSKGFEGSEFSMGISLTVEDNVGNSANVGRKQRNGWSTSAIHLEDLEKRGDVASKAVSRTVGQIGSRKPPTGEFTIIFDSSSSRSFFAGISRALSGASLYRGESFLRNAIGDSIATGILSIHENPFLPRGMGSRLFDLDGVRSRPFTVVDAGVLKNYLLGVYAANRLGMCPNGCAGGSSNFVIEPGTGTVNDLVKATPKGILVTGLMGQGADIRTGDYSRGAEGFFVENGEICYPVSEFTISSTFQEMLAGIDGIAADARPDSSILAPSVRFRRMVVAGS
ncbi:MAG: hypothetical protein DRJ14_00115 [Acidobacteria bacterium]|nr:MAG: hypothetical protein DRJ14_00115 [Acidobacteriota bacterium]